MKKFLFLAAALVFLETTALAQELSQADRDKGVKYLEETRDAVVA